MSEFCGTAKYDLQRFLNINRKGLTAMTAQPQDKNKMTPGEYLALEKSALDIKYEFFDGEAFAMVGAGRNHNRINVNLTVELGGKFKADKSTCNLFSNDMRVKIAENYVYPDIVIYCGNPEFEDDEFGDDEFGDDVILDDTDVSHNITIKPNVVALSSDKTNVKINSNGTISSLKWSTSTTTTTWKSKFDDDEW